MTERLVRRLLASDRDHADKSTKTSRVKKQSKKTKKPNADDSAIPLPLSVPSLVGRPGLEFGGLTPLLGGGRAHHDDESAARVQEFRGGKEAEERKQAREAELKDITALVDSVVSGAWRDG